MRLLLVVFFAGSCLALSELEENAKTALQEAKQALTTRNKDLKTIKEDGNHPQSQKANEESQHEQTHGDLLSETTKIMLERYGKEILPQLKALNITALIGEQLAKRKKRAAADSGCIQDDTDCNSQYNANYRTISAVCNNRENPELGKGVTVIRRLLNNASYADGIGAIRTKSATGSDLPSTREIANRLHTEGTTPIFDYMTNHMTMQFGQFVAHDIVFMPSSSGPNGESLDCSACDSGEKTENCAPIKVPANDPYFSPNGCIRLIRVVNGQKGLGQRAQINQNTHFLDLSVVYGSTGCEARKVRLFKDGELEELPLGPYTLPPRNINDTNCQSRTPNYCFLAGDFRASLHPGLGPLHAAFIKQHNAIAREMKRIRPGWDDEKTYQEARRLMIARHQHHVYNEYLPKILGQQTMQEFGLAPLTSGFFTGYDKSLNPSLHPECAAAAFRFGHSMVRKDLPRISNLNQTVGDPVDLGSNVFYAESLYDTAAGGPDSMLEGMMQRPAMAVDREFSFPIRNQLFEIRGQKASGIDLVAVNIMRGRDVGLFPYNDYRTTVGLPRAANFDDLLGQMDAANVNALKAVYASVDDIDLYSGILMERPANGALLGRTGAYIIAETFQHLKRGDRFFYESKTDKTRSFTPEELNEIRTKSTIAKFFCSVTKQMDLVNKDVFDINSQRVRCSSLPDVDVSLFTSLV